MPYHIFKLSFALWYYYILKCYSVVCLSTRFFLLSDDFYLYLYLYSHVLLGSYQSLRRNVRVTRHFPPYVLWIIFQHKILLLIKINLLSRRCPIYFSIANAWRDFYFSRITTVRKCKPKYSFESNIVCYPSLFQYSATQEQDKKNRSFCWSWKSTYKCV